MSVPTPDPSRYLVQAGLTVSELADILDAAALDTREAVLGELSLYQLARDLRADPRVVDVERLSPRSARDLRILAKAADGAEAVLLLELGRLTQDGEAWRGSILERFVDIEGVSTFGFAFDFDIAVACLYPWLGTWQFRYMLRSAMRGPSLRYPSLEHESDWHETLASALSA